VPHQPAPACMHTKCEQLSPLGRGRPATSRMLRSRRHSWAAAAAATLGSTLALPPPCAVRRMMQNSNKASPLLGGAGHCCKNLLRQRTASVPRHPPTSSLSAASAPARPLGMRGKAGQLGGTAPSTCQQCNAVRVLGSAACSGACARPAASIPACAACGLPGHKMARVQDAKR